MVKAPADAARCSTTVIARNSFWTTADLAIGVVATFFTSIAIARTIGPERLGYFNYILWLTNVGAVVGSAGIPVTVRKYMGEYLGLGNLGVARAIFFATLRAQMTFAFIVAGIGWVAVLAIVRPEYRWASMLLVATMIPRMLVFIPSQANTAAENMAGNVPSSIAATAIYTVAIGASLWFGWDLLGVAASAAIYAATELVLRLVMVLRWVRRFPAVELPADVRARMKIFSRQGLALSLLQIVVWDRSDIFFLKNLQPDIRQVAFFSLAFSVTDKLLLIPRAFGSAVGSTMMARAGRDPRTLAPLLSLSTRYTLLAALPILLGTAAMSSPMTRTLYGSQYLPLIPVLAVSALFGISKALMVPAQLMLQATERQGYLVKWTAICGCVNVALDIWLIPRYGAAGAMAANGAAQTLATAGLWAHIYRASDVPMRVGPLARIAAAALGMAATVLLMNQVTPPALAMLSGFAVGAVLFILLVRLTGALAGDDRERLMRLSPLAPRPLRPLLGRLAVMLSPVP